MVKTSFRIAFFVLIMMSACLDEPDCYNLNNYLVGISFKKLVDSSTDTLVVRNIRTEEPPVLFSDSAGISRIVLPLNYFEDETTFYFESADTTRVLRLGYTSQAQFVSENCGERFVLSDLRVLEDSFDSVRLVHDVPSHANEGVIHLEIFQ